MIHIRKCKIIQFRILAVSLAICVVLFANSQAFARSHASPSERLTSFVSMEDTIIVTGPGLFDFEHASLSCILEHIGRQYHYKVIIPKECGARTFTGGMVRRRSFQELLDFFAELSGYKIFTQDRNIIVQASAAKKR